MDIWLHALIRQACRSPSLKRITICIAYETVYVRSARRWYGGTKRESNQPADDIEYLSFSQIFSVPNPRGGGWRERKRYYNKIGTSEWAKYYAERERVRPSFSDATCYYSPLAICLSLAVFNVKPFIDLDFVRPICGALCLGKWSTPFK